MEVETYEKLEIFIDRWIAGTIDLLIIQSEPGLGKSHLIKEKLKQAEHLAVNSHVTPLANYKQLYTNKNKLVWFDDVYYIFLNKLNITLLKQLCETTEVKKVCYHTTSELIGEVPQEFTTTSKVLISCNEIEGNNPHLKAVKDRGFCITFIPTRKELLQKMREVAINHHLLEDSEKQEVLNLIEYNHKNIKNLTLRDFVKGCQLYQYYKLKGIDWKQDFLNMLGLKEKLVKMNELLVKHENDKERLTEWKWSRQTFYCYKKLAETV